MSKELTLDIIRPDLTNYQKRFLYNESRFTITEASTKIGKTYSHIWWIYERAHQSWNESGFEHWWVAPVSSQAKIAYNRLKRILIASGLYRFVESPEMAIFCPNGAVIRFKSADNPDSLYGQDVYSIVFDEAPRAKYEAFVALRSTLTSTGGPMKLIGNFGGISNWVHQLKEKAMFQTIDGQDILNKEGDKEYSYFRVTAWEGVEEGVLDREEVEQAQRDMPYRVFAQLYLAAEVETDDQLCSYDNINSMWTNTHVDSGPKYITADIALHGADKFVILVWEGLRVIDYTEVGKCEGPEVEALLKAKAEQFGVMRGNIAYDADGLGSFLRGYLQGAKPFNNGSSPIGDKNYKNLKSECGYKLAEFINSGKIWIQSHTPPKGDLMKEFECLQSYRLDDEGKIQLLPKAKIKERIGHSPDKLDAFIMRMYFEVGNKGKYNIGLNRY